MQRCPWRPAGPPLAYACGCAPPRSQARTLSIVAVRPGSGDHLAGETYQRPPGARGRLHLSLQRDEVVTGPGVLGQSPEDRVRRHLTKSRQPIAASWPRSAWEVRVSRDRGRSRSGGAHGSEPGRSCHRELLDDELVSKRAPRNLAHVVDREDVVRKKHGSRLFPPRAASRECVRWWGAV